MYLNGATTKIICFIKCNNWSKHGPLFLTRIDSLFASFSDKMAVKKHELVHDNRNQLDLQALEQYIQLMIDQSNYMPAPHELVKNCQDIVKCLESDACPATSVVLIVLDSSDTEGNLSAARWLVQQGDNGPAGAGLRASLSCLYCWLHEWHLTPALGDWVFAFIKALEENERFDILIEVSVDNLGRLFLALDDPIALRQSVADVIFHVLASLRESTEAFDRIAPHVGRVLANLANDSGQWSRQLLQNVVDILTAAVDGYVDALKGEAQEMFKDKYSDVISCLERHMASHGCRYLQQSPWRARNVCLSGANTHASMQKVGLLNLGNTCYMNSVMQALLVTRQFSTHVMLKMNAVPYWSKMGVLFSKMMHSITTKLNPDEFFSVVKPPFFTRNNQHDSSEFLGADANDNVEPRPSSSGYVAGSSSSGQKRPSGDAENGPSKKRIRMAESTFLRRDSFIDSMFGGVLLTRVECTVCHSSSLSRDVFRDLQLAFPEKLDGWQHNVQSLLEYYCSKESLTGENRYRCRDCGVLRDAERSVLIETTPKYLILILKNFKFDPKLQVQTKLMHSMYHNHNITLPTVRSQTVHASYSLYAAVIHDGTTLDSGHYYTLAKDNGQWHIYNDDTVTTSDEAELNGLNRSSTPYILFYRRTDIEEGTAPSMTELPPKVQELVMSHNKQYVEKVRTLRLTRP
ncbi:hypothetical protein B5X24_HaOG215833 [Helicoverpa armigera]|nr:hypothetical protein B5X24_HaOG215833 [Helicoverpa armigera]